MEMAAFVLALISFLLWVAMLMVVLVIYLGNRAQIRALRGMSRAMRPPPTRTVVGDTMPGKATPPPP